MFCSNLPFCLQPDRQSKQLHLFHVQVQLELTVLEKNRFEDCKIFVLFFTFLKTCFVLILVFILF